VARLRLRAETIDFNVDVSRIAGEHPRLGHVRQAMIKKYGVALADEYLSHRLAAAFAKFGHDYLERMSEHIDRIFAIRDEMAKTLDAALRGGTVDINELKNMFAELDRELDQLKSPTQAAEQATPDAPRDPPPQTAPAEAPAPARAAGEGGATRPPDHLTALARTEKVLDGLHVVESQTAAPALRSQIAAIAQRSPDQAQGLLRGIAKFLTPDHKDELQGISHYLEQGGSARALQRLLSPTEQFGAPETPDWTGTVRAGLRMMREFDAEAAHGIAVVFDSGHTAKGVLDIFANCQREPGLARGIFASLANLKEASGLKKVIAFAGGPPENFKAAQGQLLTANQLKQRYPGATLVFEERGMGRVPDIQVWGAPGGVPINVEVKFYTELDSIGSDALEQLAKDIVQDAQRRREFPRRDGTLEPPYAGTLWRFERGNLATELAAKRPGPVTPEDLVTEIKSRLKATFTKHEATLRSELGAAEFDKYKAAFDTAAFVEVY
jgi:hypothetical protein